MLRRARAVFLPRDFSPPGLFFSERYTYTKPSIVYAATVVIDSLIETSGMTRDVESVAAFGKLVGRRRKTNAIDTGSSLTTKAGEGN